MDSVQGRGPGMAFMPYCSLPELEGCMNIWQTMEMIHSRSYTHIIKNVYPDPSEVFDNILDDERSSKRAQSVTRAYDEFINLAHEYDQSNLWKDGWRDHVNSEWTLNDLKVNFIEQLQMSISLKESDSTYPSLVPLHLVNLNFWKEVLKSLVSSRGMNHNI